MYNIYGNMYCSKYTSYYCKRQTYCNISIGDFFSTEIQYLYNIVDFIHTDLIFRVLLKHCNIKMAMADQEKCCASNVPLVHKLIFKTIIIFCALGCALWPFHETFWEVAFRSIKRPDSYCGYNECISHQSLWHYAHYALQYEYSGHCCLIYYRFHAF